jgi:hypothetical protein
LLLFFSSSRGLRGDVELDSRFDAASGRRIVKLSVGADLEDGVDATYGFNELFF